MKVFICFLVLAASANAGVLLGELAGPGGAFSYPYAGGISQHANIIKVIHEQPAPSAIIKVNHQHLEPAPQIVQVVHSSPDPVVHHVKVIHEHAGVYSHGPSHDHGVKIIKVLQNHGHHGWA